MVAGKAYGTDRDYQIACRDMLIEVSKLQLIAASGDGIDVQFNDLGGTNVTFDVALKDTSGNFIIAECRRQVEKVKQEAIFAFAYKVEMLRKYTGQKVDGVFFTKSHYQLGALKHAEWSGIQLAVFGQDQNPLHSFALMYSGYDRERELRIESALIKPLPVEAFATAIARVILCANDETEDLDELK
jgi:hypothetical protein